jgi:hypothetical protein
MNSLKNLGGHSSALSALSKKAEKIKAEAEGMKIVSDIQQAPLNQAAELNALRASVNKPMAESAADRLKRLSAG